MLKCGCPGFHMNLPPGGHGSKLQLNSRLISTCTVFIPPSRWRDDVRELLSLQRMGQRMRVSSYAEAILGGTGFWSLVWEMCQSGR